MLNRRIAEILRSGKPEETLVVQGWVRTKRELKGFAFLEVNDGSSLGNLQVVINQDLPDYQGILKQINTIQFVINQMFIELSTFKNSISNKSNDIEKFHHNCKVDEIKPIENKSFRFANMMKLLAEEDDDEDEVKQHTVQPRTNINVYRVWKD